MTLIKIDLKIRQLLWGYRTLPREKLMLCVEHDGLIGPIFDGIFSNWVGVFMAPDPASQPESLAQPQPPAHYKCRLT